MMKIKCYAEREKIIVNREWCKKVKCKEIDKCDYLKHSERLFAKFIVKTKIKSES